MDFFVLADYIIEAYELPPTLGKYSFSTHDLVLGLLEFNSIKDVAIFLDTTDSALEHLIRRKIRPQFPGKKPSSKTWKAYFLSIFDLKVCSKCGEIKDIFEFSKDMSRSSTYMCQCKYCDAKRSALYKASNREKTRQASSKHYVNNRAYYLAKTALYRANKVRATPIWADLVKIKEVYLNCPVDMHVDHIFPLNSDWVCGLHNEFNLQYLSPEDNLKKSNKNIGQ